MKLTLLKYLLCILCLPSWLLASQNSIRSSQFLAKSYAKETVFEFQKGEAYPLLSTDDVGYYVHIYNEHDRVLLLEDPVSLPARIEGDQLVFWESYIKRSDRAYLVFLPDAWHRVLSETEAKYQIEYSFGRTKMRFSVDKAEFVIANHILDRDGSLIDRKVVEPQDAVCVLNFSSGVSGSGFLLYVDDKLYCYTNQHVAMNVGALSVSLIDGSRLEIGALEIAEDADLARIEILQELPGFDVRGTPALQEKVRVLGNSLGAGRITVLPGTVTGLNATEIETSAKFVSGNSGSPILNADDEVIGVATLIEFFPDHEKIVKGSGFEDGRRVGFRLDREIEWIQVELGQYISRNRHLLQTSIFIDELPYAMLATIQGDGAGESAVNQFTDPIIKQWLRSMRTRMQAVRLAHKEKVDAGIARMGNRFLYTSGYAAMQKAYASEAITTSGNYWNSLRQKVVSKKRSTDRTIPYPDTSYMRHQIANTIDMLDAALAGIDVIQESHRAYADEL